MDNFKKKNQKLLLLRWLGFFLAVIGAFILGDAKIYSQWLGWTICCTSCSIWILMGVIDKDIPRTLMEIMYLVLGIRAVISWINI